MYQRQALAATGGQSPAQAEAAASAAQAGDTVSLSGDAATPAADAPQAGRYDQPAEVFAEIWKDGTKIGTVYTDGQAVLPSSAASAAAGHGATRPYLRAQEISRLVGGEVPYVDIPALQVAQTRAQLRAAYGA